MWKIEGKNTPTENKEKTLDGYIEIGNVADKSDKIVNTHRDFLEKQWIYPFDFEEFLEKFLWEQNINENEITHIKPSEDSFFMKINNNQEFSFSLIELQEYIAAKVLKWVSKSTIEKRVANINTAIESIYDNNDGYIFDGEINDKDKVKDWEFKWKTLKELRGLLDIETHKLYHVYEITWESNKKEELLKQEIEFFAGVWDRYEWWARYFSLSDDEVQKKVAMLTQNMDINEVFSYIIEVNESIENNWRKSDMVNHVNTKLVQALYIQTLERLKEKNSPNADFIKFAQVVTWRAKIQREMIANMWYQPKPGETYEYTVEIDNNYKAIDLACRALIHIMYRENWVLDKITEKQEVTVEDPEVADKSPWTIVSKTIALLDSVAPNTPWHGKQTLIDAWFEELIWVNTEYNNLEFEDKINIWAIYRIGELIKSSSPEDLTNPGFVGKKVWESLTKSYEELNESFSDNFDGYKWIFWGKDASELGLEDDLAIIFDLYQDINGNSGFLDWSDKNIDKFTNLSTWAVLGVWLIAGAIIFAPLLAAGTGATAWAMMLAWAQAWAITGIASVGFSRQWYDTYLEAATDSFTQIAADTALGAAFAWWGLSLLRKLKLNQLTKQYIHLDKMPIFQNYMIRNSWSNNLSPNLIWWKAAWWKLWSLDKWFILSETMLTGFVASRFVSRKVRKSFEVNHFNTDEYKYENWKKVRRTD